MAVSVQYKYANCYCYMQLGRSDYEINYDDDGWVGCFR